MNCFCYFIWKFILKNQESRADSGIYVFRVKDGKTCFNVPLCTRVPPWLWVFPHSLADSPQCLHRTLQLAYFAAAKTNIYDKEEKKRQSIHNV